MKKVIQFFIICLSLLLVGCNEELEGVSGVDNVVERDDSWGVTIALANVASFDQPLSFPIGSEILINASGALSAVNQKYYWDGSSWIGTNKLIWDKDKEHASLLALYPCHSNYLYTSSELYSDGMLLDLLYDYHDIYDKKEINLAFKHCFSLLSISSSAQAKRELKWVKLKVPCTISSLSVDSGEIGYDFTTEQIVTLPANEEGEYLFIIPPVENLQLELELMWSDELITHTLAPVSFKSNHRYDYHFKSSEECVGIRTVDDFIAFGKLVNGEDYDGDKTLADFGTTQDGITTYYLLNDLYFEPEDSLRLSSIGQYTFFNDVFEGNNYTVSGLRLQRLEGGYGLFNQVGSRGVVRNLHVKDSYIHNVKSSNLTSFIASYNLGLIEYCSVINSSISIPGPSIGGMIAGSSLGVILNCWSWNCSLDLGINSCIGGITGHSEGKIFNCYAGNHTFTNRVSSFCGGISARVGMPGTIQNCYYYNSQSTVQRLGGVLNTALDGKVVISNCYTNSNYLIRSNEWNISMAENFQYDSNFVYNNGEQQNSVLTSLNEWIEMVGVNLTSQPLRKWRLGENGMPACFID